MAELQMENSVSSPTSLRGVNARAVEEPQLDPTMQELSIVLRSDVQVA